MPDDRAPTSFRANDEDRRILADLSKRLGLKMGQVIRLALRRFYDEESKRQPKKLAPDKTSRR